MDDREDVLVTRSEEELRISTHRRESGRARLVKYVETETVTRTVELRREQVRVEYEALADSDFDPGAVEPSAAGARDAGASWMVLYDEEVVLTTRRVPRERVRLRTKSVTEEREISEMVRKEKLGFVDDDQTS